MGVNVQGEFPHMRVSAAGQDKPAGSIALAVQASPTCNAKDSPSLHTPRLR